MKDWLAPSDDWSRESGPLAFAMAEAKRVAEWRGAAWPWRGLYAEVLEPTAKQVLAHGWAGSAGLSLAPRMGFRPAVALSWSGWIAPDRELVMLRAGLARGNAERGCWMLCPVQAGRGASSHVWELLRGAPDARMQRMAFVVGFEAATQAAKTLHVAPPPFETGGVVDLRVIERLLIAAGFMPGRLDGLPWRVYARRNDR